MSAPSPADPLAAVEHLRAGRDGDRPRQRPISRLADNCPDPFGTLAPRPCRWGRTATPEMDFGGLG